MAKDFLIRGAVVEVDLTDQGPAADWRFGIDRGGATLLSAVEPESATANEITHSFSIPAGAGTTAWFERVLPSGAVIGSRTVSAPFAVVDDGPPPPVTRTYRVSGVITVEPIPTATS